MVCKLCQNNTFLCSSHIIPETFFKGVYGKKNRAVPISLENPSLKLVQQGDREKLLCKKCEQKFSKWEKILKSDLVDIEHRKDNRLRFTRIDENYFKVKNIQYKEFKLGILSILWRMSVASNTDFSCYKLGEHEEILREILMREELLDESRYPIIVQRCEFFGHFHHGMIQNVSTENKNQILKNESFVIWGHYFTVFLNNNIFSKMPELFLRNSGDLLVPICNFNSSDFATGLLSRVFDNDVNQMYRRL